MKNKMIWRNFLSIFSALGQALSAWATVAAFCLALWAYFFSSLPDELIKKFNSDIALANEELVDIRQEKRKLEVQTEEVQKAYDVAKENYRVSTEKYEADKLSFEQKTQDLINETNKAESSLKIIKKENIKNLKLRKLYVAQNTKSILGITFKNAIFQDIAILKTEAKQASELISWKNAIRVEDVSDKDKDRLEDLSDYEREMWHIKRESEIRERKINDIPDSWLDLALIGNGLMRWDGKNPPTQHELGRIAYTMMTIGDENPEVSEKRDENTAHIFRKAISLSPPYQTGVDLLKHHLKMLDDELADISDEDRKNINDAIQVFMRKNSEILSAPIAVVVPVSVDDSAVVTVGNNVLKNIENLEALLNRMPQDVANVHQN